MNESMLLLRLYWWQHEGKLEDDKAFWELFRDTEIVEDKDGS